jgi:hypothetical protein
VLLAVGGGALLLQRLSRKQEPTSRAVKANLQAVPVESAPQKAAPQKAAGKSTTKKATGRRAGSAALRSTN